MAYQTHKNIAIVVIDDQSTDRTKSILESCWDNVSCKGKYHVGRPPIVETWAGERAQCCLSNVLNRGIEIALGLGADYIARMDGDDESNLFRIEAQLDHMRSKNLDLCGTFAHIIGPNGNLVEDFHPYIREGDERLWLTKFNYFIHGSVVMSSKLAREIGGYYTGCRYVEDYELWLRAANSYRVGVAPYYLYTLYRGPSMTDGKGAEIYNIAKGLREEWANKWNIQIPDHDLPDYCTVMDSKI